MHKKQFIAGLNKIIPSTDTESTAGWINFAATVPYESLRTVYNSLAFIARHFDPNTTQKVYVSIGMRKNTQILPGEVLAAAIHFENGASQDNENLQNTGITMT